MKFIQVRLAALVLFASTATAQSELVHYDFVGNVDNTAAPATTLAPGFAASPMTIVGATPGTFLDGFSGWFWSNSITPDPNQYIEFSVTGSWLAGEIRHDWYPSSWGPIHVAARSSLDSFATDIATDTRPLGNFPTPEFEASLDISSLGALSGTTTFRLYHYGGGNGNNPYYNIMLIRGSAYGSRGLKVFERDSGPFPSSCDGDGGNQTGCTSCPCMNNAPRFTRGGCRNSAGTSALLNANGDTSVSLFAGATTDLRFRLSGAPPSAFCILNSGDGLAPTNPASPCFGMDSGVQATSFDGLRCAVVNTRRHGGRTADANGDVGLTNNPWGGESGPSAAIAQAGLGFASGQTRYFQVIHRDDPLLSCMRGLNTSQAVEVTFTP